MAKCVCHFARYCLGIQLMCGATCWTDHKLVRAKLRCGLYRSCCQSGGRLAPVYVQRFADPTMEQSFSGNMSECLGKIGPISSIGTMSAWDQICECLVSVVTIL